MVRLLLLAAVCVAVAVAVPARPQADPPPGPDVCTFDTKDACDAVPCCTWCGSKWSPTGWCSKVASWAKNCTKSVTTCQMSMNQTQCCATNMCTWTPLDSKEPVPCTGPEPPEPPEPPTPPPTFSCEFTTAEECDANACCNWCSSTWNASASWCMPVLNEAVPMATCSKDTGPCDIKTQDDCDASDTCTWLAFETSEDVRLGKGRRAGVVRGVCVTDWKKCWSRDLSKHSHPALLKDAAAAEGTVRAAPWASKHIAKMHLAAKHRKHVQRMQLAAQQAANPKPNGTCTSVCPKQ